jgi:predicted phosphoribosyltransferase
MRLHSRSTLPYAGRREAGEALAKALKGRVPAEATVVLALPRGGVPVAYEVAQALGAPLDVLVVRKLGVPGHEELAMGAIAAGVRVLREDVIAELDISPAAIEAVAAREERELARREQAYRRGHPPLPLAGKHVIVVDDGLATGATMRAAVEAIRQARPASVTVAVPVAAKESVTQLRRVADAVVAAATPEPFDGVGLWYRDFSPTTDDEVCELLDRAREGAPPGR